MSLFPIGAENCLIKTVNRTSTSANKVCRIESNSKHKKCMVEGFVSLSWVVWLHEKMVSWPRFQGHKTIFSCNMHIFFNMFSQQLPPSFCVSFKHYPAADLSCSTLVKMQQSFFFFFLIGHVWLRADTLPPSGFPCFLINLFLTINWLVLIQSFCSGCTVYYSAETKLFPRKYQRNIETHCCPWENDRCQSDLQSWTQCSPHALSLKPFVSSFCYLLQDT